MSAITIYHNSACGTSRNTLALIRESGEEPRIIDYLKNPPTAMDLRELLAAMKIPARDLLRAKEPRYVELDLANPKWTDEQLIDFMVANPVVMNRPIVVTARGAALCRPAEKVLSLLPGR